MKKRNALILVATIAIIVAGSFFYVDQNKLPEGADPHNQLQVSNGKIVYAENCASCHGKNLEGQPNWRTPLREGGLPAPPHDAKGHTWHHPDRFLFDYTKLGGKKLAPATFKSNMPGFEDKLSDGQIWAVLSFIKSTWPQEIRRRQAQRNQSK